MQQAAGAEAGAGFKAASRLIGEKMDRFNHIDGNAQ
jgi:hypothetical protein